MKLTRGLCLLLFAVSAAWGQASPTAPSSLLPAAGPYDVARYLNIRSAIAPAYSPGSDDVAYLTNTTGTNQVWKSPARGGYPEQLTFFDDRVQEMAWSPRGDVILFTKDQGGDERSQLYLMDPDGQVIVPLTQNPKAIFRFGDFSRDGAWICYSSNERDPHYFDVYVMELATRRARRLLSGDVNYYAHSFSPDGRSLLVEREHSSYDNDLFLLDVAKGSAQLLTPHSGDATYRDMIWDPAGSGFYLGSDQGREHVNLAFFDLRQKALSFLENSNLDLDEATGIAIDRGGNRLFYAWNDAGGSLVRIRNLKADTVDLFRSLPRGVAGHGSFNGDGSKVAFSYSAPTMNGDVYVLDLNANQAREVTHSTHAGIPESSLVTPELVTYTSFDGTKVPALFYLPPGAQKDGKLPAIVSIHGGPEGQERPVFNAIYQYFLNRGYAVLAPNIRGSAGFGRSYMQLDNYKKRPDAIQDAAFTVDFLKSTGYVDAHKIAVMGGSYGGFMALAQATMHPELWAATVDIVGIANWATFFQNTGPWRRAFRVAEYGDPVTDPEFMASISPIHYVDKIRAPLFVIAGANDPRVPKEEADQMVAKVKERGVPVEYIAFPDEGHGMAKRANRIRGYTAIAEFLDKYVKNGK
jgi:dipeptidyl aminopeptidase/acylaminoacyl peptidase